mgnify:CR=1 FL=1
MSHNCTNVQQHYKVPAEIVRRVLAHGEPGVILRPLHRCGAVQQHQEADQ